MPVFGKPNSSEISFSQKAPEGFIRIIGDKERPTPDHICSTNGIWILPKKTNADIALERKVRYEKETDDLRNHIVTDMLRGKDVAEKKAEWEKRVNQIKQDLPFIN